MKLKWQDPEYRSMMLEKNIMTKSDYIKPKETGIVINTNENELDRYLAQREKLKKDAELSGKITKLEDDVSEIKDLLKLLLSKERINV